MVDTYLECEDEVHTYMIYVPQRTRVIMAKYNIYLKFQFRNYIDFMSLPFSTSLIPKIGTVLSNQRSKHFLRLIKNLHLNQNCINVLRVHTHLNQS